MFNNKKDIEIVCEVCGRSKFYSCEESKYIIDTYTRDKWYSTYDHQHVCEICYNDIKKYVTIIINFIGGNDCIFFKELKTIYNSTGLYCLLKNALQDKKESLELVINEHPILINLKNITNIEIRDC